MSATEAVEIKDRSEKKDRKERKEKKEKKEKKPKAESSDMAAPTDAPEASAEAGPSSPSQKKRTRPDIPEEDLLEISIDAPEPLSKAEARAAKKRAKLGKPEIDPAELKKELKRKRDKLSSKKDNQDDLLGDDIEKVKVGTAAEAEAETLKREKPKKQNSIWIGNLSFRTTQEGIKAFFDKGLEESGGKPGSVTRVNLPKKTDKGSFSQNKGYAYVDFETPEMQALAIGLSERLLEGRKVLIKRGDDYNANPDARTPKPLAVKPGSASILAKQPNKESATLFIGNLPFDATEEALRELLEFNADEGAAAAEAKDEDRANDKDEEEKEKVVEEVKGAEDGEKEGEDGEKAEAPKRNDLDAGREGKRSGLRKIRLGQFEDTGRCKGFGFIDFLTPRHATVALSNRKNHYFAGRKLLLQYASESATRRSGAKTGDEAESDRPPRGGFKSRGGGPGARDGGRGREGDSDRPERPNKRFRDDQAGAGTEEAGAGAEGGGEDESWQERKAKKNDQRGKKWEATGRPRPGAALAMAKREKVGIVEGKGAKIVFD